MRTHTHTHAHVQAVSYDFRELLSRVRKREFKARLTRLPLYLHNSLAIDVQVRIRFAFCRQLTTGTCRDRCVYCVR
jgi:hypothetical protein